LQEKPENNHPRGIPGPGEADPNNYHCTLPTVGGW